MRAWPHTTSAGSDTAVAAWNKSLNAAERLAMPYEQGRAYYELGRHLPPDHPSRTGPPQPRL